MDISVIVPIYNEEKYIDELLNNLLHNNIKYKNKMLIIEFLLIDGGSSDSTLKKISKYEKKDSRIKILHNKQQYQVYALNIGIQKAQGEIIIRCDAHASYPNNYFINLYSFLKNTPNAGNVGVKSITKPGDNSIEAEIVSKISSSKFGVGTSHRTLHIKKPIEVDTLLFGAWHKKIFDEIGLFDETFIRGQDYEHNYRLKEYGKSVLLIPGEGFFYYTRTKIHKMFKMFFQYAHAKTHIIKKYHTKPTIRSMFPIFLWLFILMSIINPIFLIPLTLYIPLVLFYSIKLANSSIKKTLMYIYGFIGIHLFYFLGFCKGIYDYFIIRKKVIELKHTR